MVKTVNLTPAFIKSLKPQPKTYLIYDAGERRMALRVLPTGVKSYGLVVRPPGQRHPTFITLAKADEISLAEVREQAHEWKKLIKLGRDPRDEVRRARQVEVDRRALTFGVAMEDFFKRHLKGKRKEVDYSRGAARRNVSLLTNPSSLRSPRTGGSIGWSTSPSPGPGSAAARQSRRAAIYGVR